MLSNLIWFCCPPGTMIVWDMVGSGIFNGTLWMDPGTERGTDPGMFKVCMLTGTIDLSEP